MKVKICKICGRICSPGEYFGQEMCSKHYQQYLKYGRTLDNNPRTVWDPNEIRVLDGYAEIDTYTNTGEVLVTYKLDIEDIPLLGNHKWRTVFKGKSKSPYLVTGHTIYFHRLIMGNPVQEVDHINRDSTDNRKSNLRISYRTQQLVNTKVRSDSTSGIKGVYYVNPRGKRRGGYRAEIQCNGKHIYSLNFETIEEAAYMRYLLEQFFYKGIGMHNSNKLISLIRTLSPEKKHFIDTYFTNRAKAWV